MIKWYYQGNSYQNVSGMFASLYPVPGKSTIERTIKKFGTKGTVINNCRYEARQEQREYAINDRDLQVLLCVEENNGKIRI